MSKDLASPIIKKTAIDKDGVAHYLVEGGLTKREHFAAMAMQALIANQGVTPFVEESLAAWAIAYAETLLKQLSEIEQ